MELDFLHLNFRRRIAVALWGQRLTVVGGIAWLLLGQHGPGSVAFVLFAGFVFIATLAWVEKSMRRQFIREARLPPFLIGKLRAAHPQLSRRDAELVLRGLRQFFMAHLRSDRKFVAMPSRVVDTAWHEFILHTQAYQTWCQAAFGRMLHHSPAEVLGKDAKRNDGLRRTWYWACKEESIDPRNPARLPLLFALDIKFAIANGFHYIPDCRAVEREIGSDAHCGTSFGESSSDGGSSGDAGGFGGSESGGGGDGGSSDGGGASDG
ncbi:glycine-rich domain-containing protein, partial [Acidovorax cavernicola]